MLFVLSPHHRKYVIAIFAFFFLLSCKDWKDWAIVRDDRWFQIRYDEQGQKWIFLIKNEESPGEEDFEKEIGPFNGYAPIDIEPFDWNPLDLESIFGTKDSVQYKTTIVICNPREADEQEYCDVRIINFAGKVLGNYSVKGLCGETRLNPQDHSKLILVDKSPGTGWILIDYLTGQKEGESPNVLPPDVHEQALKELEILDDKIIMVEERDPLTRISLYNMTGIFLREFTIPGDFKLALNNNLDKKIFITQTVSGTYGDIINVSDNSLIHVGGSINVSNPLPGVFIDAQYHKIQNKDRWVHASYQQGINNTSIRIIDENGIVLRTHVFAGKGVDKEVMGMDKDRKVWAMDRDPTTDIAVINLINGALVRFQNLPGNVSRMNESLDKLKAVVTTTMLPNGEQISEVPLY